METCEARIWHDQRQVWTINMPGLCFKVNSCKIMWQHVIQIMVRGNESLWLTGIRSQSIDLILAILNDDPCSMVIWECLHNWNFPMQFSIYVCVCECASDVSLSYFFPSPPSTSSITPRLHHMLCSSLAFISGLVEFPGRLWKPVRISSPHLSTHPPRHHAHSILCCFFFPDCNASVHKGCRDSLPVCAKVKMKVKVPSE